MTRANAEQIKHTPWFAKAAAALLGVHPRTLQRMVLRGQIAGVQVGKLWRFRASAIDQWIDRKQAG